MDDSFFRFTVLGTVLSWGLIRGISFADVPSQGNDPVVSFPSIDMTLKTDGYAKGDQIGKHDSRSPGGRDACFAIGDRLGPPGYRGGSDGLVLPMTVCVGSPTAIDEIGWAGYEARGDHAKSIGNWSDAEKAYVKAVELLGRAIIQDVDQDLAALLNKLGTMRFRLKDFAGAETAHRRALTLYRGTRGAEDLRVAETLDLLATALFEQQYGHELAGSLFFRAWAIREMFMGPNHPDVAESLHHVALSLYSDNLSLAIPLLVRSRDIREKVFGHDHPLVAESLNAMARLYEANNCRDLAIPLYQQALTIQEKVFGPNASETTQIRNKLDMAHQATNDSVED